MRNFLKHILKKSQSEITQSVAVPVISNSGTTLNNNCETIREGFYIVPQGTTATVLGEFLAGVTGSGNPGPVNGAPMIVGTLNNVQPGTYQFSANFGNSGQQGIPSTYRITVTLDNNNSKSLTLQRTQFNSSFYDQDPC